MSDDGVRPAWAEEIRTKRLRLCWTQNEMAKQLELAADANTRAQLPSRSSIIREIRFHESGTHRPGPIYAELYRRVWAGVSRLWASKSENGFQHADPGDRSAEPGSIELEDPTRIVAQARTITASNVDYSVLEMTRRSIEHVVASYESLGPWPLVAEVRCLRRTLHVLLDGRQSPYQRRELFLLAGRVAGLLAYMAVNTGRPVVAEAYCTEASLLAQEADDVELQMWVLGTRSFGLYYQGRYNEADAAAAAAITMAPSNPQVIRLLINGRARALARMGQSGNQAEKMVGEALSVSSRTNGLPDGMSSCIAFAPYSPARTMANAVTAFLSLGKACQVLDHARQLDDLVESSHSQWSKALVRLDVASALIAKQSPEVEQAMVLGREALEMTSAVPIRSVGQRAHELAVQVGPWAKNSEVEDYRQQLREWRARPLACTVEESSA